MGLVAFHTLSSSFFQDIWRESCVFLPLLFLGAFFQKLRNYYTISKQENYSFILLTSGSTKAIREKKFWFQLKLGTYGWLVRVDKPKGQCFMD